MNGTVAQYTFIPWYRRGMANQITNTSTSSYGRASVNVKVYYKTSPQQNNPVMAADKNIELIGPGDVAQIDPQVVIKTEPANGVNNFEHNYLAYIDFYEEDFLWRYSPLQSPANGQLIPWLFLLVVKEDEFEYNPPDLNLPLQSIKLKSSDPLSVAQEDLWAWAHVQVNKRLDAHPNDNAALRAELADCLALDPDIAFSRLMSPRKLEKNMKYHAFLVPSFQSGVISGLGGAIAETQQASSPAWTSTTVEPSFPFYYQWEFKTSYTGDFEALARILKPVIAADIIEMPKMDIEDMVDHFDPDENWSNPTLEVDFPTAYKAPGVTLQPWPNNNSISDGAQWLALRDRVNLNVINPVNENEDPIVNIPPMYGMWHAAQNQLNLIPNPSTNNKWLYDINLHPALRAVAGLGTKIVQEQQELFMDEAWGQLGEVLEANKQLRNTQMAIEINKKILTKHIAPRDPEDILAMTEKLHRKIKEGSKTIDYHVKTSNLTKAGVNAGLSKVLRKNGKTAKKLNKQIDPSKPIEQANLRFELNSDNAPDITGARAKPVPYEVTGQYSAQSLNNITDPDISPEEGQVSTALVQFASTSSIPQGTQLGISGTMLPKVFSKINPAVALGERVLRKIPLTEIPAFPSNSVSRIKPVMAAPELPYPMYEYLLDLSPEFIIPGLSGVENNSVFVMEPDRTFIETFLAGANHEMARELLWRSYPTDQRGTYFNKFWNTDDFLNLDNATIDFEDIRPMHQWSGGIGNHPPANGIEAGLVLIFRGDLFRKFPNTIIYAHKAIPNPDYPSSDPNNPQTERILASDIPQHYKFPIFKAQINPDITIIGFDMTPAEARGSSLLGDGWFFMLKERLGEPRFGLDYPEDNNIPTLNSWDDLTWHHLNSNPDSILSIDINDQPSQTPANNPDNIIYGDTGNSAHMAYILYQVPVQVGIHASDLIPPPNNSGPVQTNSNYQSMG